MQKVVGSSPIIRSDKGPAKGPFLYQRLICRTVSTLGLARKLASRESPNTKRPPKGPLVAFIRDCLQARGTLAQATLPSPRRRPPSVSRRTPRTAPFLRSPDPRDELDLDHDVERQLRHAHRRAGVPTGFAEELHEQVG